LGLVTALSVKNLGVKSREGQSSVLPVNVIVLGPPDFNARLKASLEDRVANLIVLEKLSPDIVRYAGRRTAPIYK